MMNPTPDKCMKVGDLVKITGRCEPGRIILLLKSHGRRSYNLGKDVGELFAGIPLGASLGVETDYFVFENNAEVISESR